jgi:predicted Zn-dependent protease
MGRHDEALAEAMRAQELSPRSGVMAMAVANVLFHARRYDEAVAAARELVTLFSTAEAAGEWPEVEGRFVRPGSVASIDVLCSE